MATTPTLPFDDRDGFIWYNGEIVNWRDAKVHLLNHGLHYASSVFEGERVYNGKVFKLTEHSERFKKSAQILGFEIPYSVEELNEFTNLIVKKQGIVDGYVRPVAWLGSEYMKIYAPGNKVHTAIATWVWPTYFAPELYEKGINLCWADWKRPAPDTAPTAAKAAGLYMICTTSKRKAEETGFHDAMMLDYRGYIAEATGANFFMVVDGELHTPIADCFLNGITRLTVIDLAKSLGIKVVERHMKPEELAKGQEAFLTGTAAEITPVGSIGEYKFKPGAVTKKLTEAYHALVRS
jgi:branched-chain amino acid aminotransferase